MWGSSARFPAEDRPGWCAEAPRGFGRAAGIELPRVSDRQSGPRDRARSHCRPYHRHGDRPRSESGPVGHGAAERCHCCPRPDRGRLTRLPPLATPCERYGHTGQSEDLARRRPGVSDLRVQPPTSWRMDGGSQGFSAASRMRPGHWTLTIDEVAVLPLGAALPAAYRRTRGTSSRRHAEPTARRSADGTCVRTQSHGADPHRRTPTRATPREEERTVAS